MNVNEIANILLNMSLDLSDLNDLDEIKKELPEIEKTVQALKTMENSLYYVLENIASINENLYNFMVRG